MNPSLSVVSLPWMLGLQEGGYSCRIMLRDISKTFFALFIIYLYIATGCHLRRTSQWYHDLIWKGSSFQGYHRKLTYSQSYGTENDLHRVTAFPGFQSNLSSSVLSVGLQCRMCFMFVLVSFEFPGIPIFATREISYLSFLDSHLSYPWEYHGGGRNHARNNEKLQTKKKKKNSARRRCWFLLFLAVHPATHYPQDIFLTMLSADEVPVHISPRQNEKLFAECCLYPSSLSPDSARAGEIEVQQILNKVVVKNAYGQ